MTYVTPLIAIVGRPNVGKSTLFNRLLGHRTAIVHDLPGVTRDRHYGTCTLMNHTIRLVDTGGFAPGESEGMLPLMREQAQIAIDEADAILFLCNARDGVTAADEEIADVLRRTEKPVFCAANKCDSDRLDLEAMALYSLGFDEIYPVAAEHNRGVIDLVEAIVAVLEERGAFEGEEPEPEAPLEPTEKVRGGVVERVRVAFVGRPNVGKSTLVNKLLGHERVICADVPGTTRDAIDIDFTWKDEAFTLVDTAGLRRKRNVEEAIEQYSVSQAVRAIERCHVAVLVLDATKPLADQDSKIAALILDRSRACVVAVNKWDLVDKTTMTMKGYELALADWMPFLSHVPSVFISAKSGQRVENLFEKVREVYACFNRRIGTGELNRWLNALQDSHQAPTYRSKSLRMYYAAQVGVRPPQFVIQVNTLGAISPAYERFLMGQMRQQWDLLGTPLKLRLKKKAARRARIGGIGAGQSPELDPDDFEADGGDFGPDPDEDDVDFDDTEE